MTKTASTTALLLTTIVLLASPVSAHAALLTNITSYWTLDQSSGNALDSVSSNTLTKAGTVTYAAGKINNAATNGSGGSLLISNASQSGLNITGDISISLWVYLTAAPANATRQQWFGKSSNTNLGGYEIDYDTNAVGDGSARRLIFGSAQDAIQYYWAAGYSPGPGSTDIISLNTWHHLVFTRVASSGQIDMYLDGSSIFSGTSNTGNINSSTASAGVGNLAGSTNNGYYTAAPFNGALDEVGVWSRALSAAEVTLLYKAGAGCQYSFTTCTGTVTPFRAVQDFIYQYDNNGNITEISNLATSTAAAVTTSFNYDQLNRLVMASTTYASSSPFYRLFAYDALGSITSVNNGTATTTYTYGNTGYANPHAVTSYGGNSYGYDSAGNLTSASSSTFTYDYRNRMTQAVTNGTTTTYTYTHDVSRVTQTTANTTTIYPNKYYSITSTKSGATTTATTTEYVYNGDTLIATIDQVLVNGTATGSPITSFIYPDHLGSTNVVADNTGKVVQTMDYVPYGATRLNAATGKVKEKRQYIGQFADASSLNYLNARYYDAPRGQFTSEDPVFWEVGQTSDGKQVMLNPQALNSYGYANDNPINLKDPQGRLAPEAAVGAVVGTVVGIAGQGIEDYRSGRTSGLDAYSASAAGGFVAGAAIGATDGIPLIYSLLAAGPAAGAAGGATKSITQQTIQAAGGASIDISKVQSEAVSGAAFGFIPGLDLLPGMNVRGAIMPVTRTLYSKLDRNIIQGLSSKSLFKLYAASTLQQAPGAVAQSALKSSNNQQAIPLSGGYLPSPAIVKTLSNTSTH